MHWKWSPDIRPLQCSRKIRPSLLPLAGLTLRCYLIFLPSNHKRPRLGGGVGGGRLPLRLHRSSSPGRPLVIQAQSTYPSFLVSNRFLPLGGEALPTNALIRSNSPVSRPDESYHRRVGLAFMPCRGSAGRIYALQPLRLALGKRLLIINGLKGSLFFLVILKNLSSLGDLETSKICVAILQRSASPPLLAVSC